MDVIFLLTVKYFTAVLFRLRTPAGIFYTGHYFLYTNHRPHT